MSIQIQWERWLVRNCLYFVRLVALLADQNWFGLIFHNICLYSWINSLDQYQCIDIYLLPMVTCKFLIFLSAGWWFLMMWNLMQFSAFDCPQDLSLDQINPIGLNFDHPCRQKRAPLAAVLSLSLCGALHCEGEVRERGPSESGRSSSKRPIYRSVQWQLKNEELFRPKKHENKVRESNSGLRDRVQNVTD